MKLVEGIADVDDVDAFVERVAAVSGDHGVAVQVLDAGLVADAAHLRSAVGHANRSVERDENVADDRAVEILLYAAGRRQIREALAMGVTEGKTPAVAVVDDGRLRPGEPAEPSPAERRAAADIAKRLESATTLGTPDEERLADFFAVGDVERSASAASLPELVRERVALLDVEK